MGNWLWKRRQFSTDWELGRRQGVVAVCMTAVCCNMLLCKINYLFRKAREEKVKCPSRFFVIVQWQRLENKCDWSPDTISCAWEGRKCVAAPTGSLSYILQFQRQFEDIQWLHILWINWIQVSGFHIFFTAVAVVFHIIKKTWKWELKEWKIKQKSYSPLPQHCCLFCIF